MLFYPPFSTVFSLSLISGLSSFWLDKIIEKVIQCLLLGSHASSLWCRVTAVLALPDRLACFICIDCMLGLHATVRPVTKSFGFGNVI